MLITLLLAAHTLDTHQSQGAIIDGDDHIALLRIARCPDRARDGPDPARVAATYKPYPVLKIAFAELTARRRELVVVEANMLRAVVSYADLDLTGSAGHARLNRRVESAAKQLCHGTDFQPLAGMIRRERCFEAAMASAAPQVAKAITNTGDRFTRGRVTELASAK